MMIEGCSMAKFKIFYSWQSDLPKDKTRDFIRGCIDDAVYLANESETIEASRDEATKGLTGSPDIVNSIYSKIDECDMFIADVSLCFKGDFANVDKEKHSPNPNVMFELGYAVKTLSWERVICLYNSDFGSDYPFDINHNRLTSFSLDEEDKKKVRRELTKIILTNIQTLQGQIPRPKTGFSSHIIGSYDFNQKKITPEIIPIDFCNSDSFALHNMELLCNARNLLAEIQAISERMDSIKSEKKKAGNPIPDSTIPQNDQIHVQIPNANYLTKFDKESETPAVWNNIEEDKELIKRFLDKEVGDSFFDLGDLKLVKPAFSFEKETKHGSEDEKNKYDKLLELSCILSLYELRNMYLKTFDGIMYIPLAIKNYSSTADTNIRIIVNVEKGEIVDPSEQLIVKELDGCQGLFCSDDEPGVISELFILAEDGNVHYDKNQFDYAAFTPRSPILTENGFEYPPKTAEDYKTELEWYIASAAGNDFYEFEVYSLRANECCWLGQGLLMKPVDGNIVLNYRIHSDHSTGELSGKLELNTNVVES